MIRDTHAAWPNLYIEGAKGGLVSNLSCREVEAVACLACPGKLEVQRKNLTTRQVFKHLDQRKSRSGDRLKVFADIEKEMLERNQPLLGQSLSLVL